MKGPAHTRLLLEAQGRLCRMQGVLHMRITRSYMHCQRQSPGTLARCVWVQAILVFDVSDRSSFDALNDWLTEARDYGAKKLQVVVCGNKVG